MVTMIDAIYDRCPHYAPAGLTWTFWIVSDFGLTFRVLLVFLFTSFSLLPLFLDLIISLLFHRYPVSFSSFSSLVFVLNVSRFRVLNAVTDHIFDIYWISLLHFSPLLLNINSPSFVSVYQSHFHIVDLLVARTTSDLLDLRLTTYQTNVTVLAKPRCKCLFLLLGYDG